LSVQGILIPRAKKFRQVCERLAGKGSGSTIMDACRYPLHPIPFVVS
jgi:hypothetical protein